MDFKGSCLCGEVQYELSGNPKWFYHCHCQRCRKASGTGHTTGLFIRSDNFVWKKGEEWLKKYKVPDAEHYYNQFCSNCGSGMPRVMAKINAVLLPAGSLDHEILLKPEARIFWDSRARWSCSGDELPVFSEFPE